MDFSKENLWQGPKELILIDKIKETPDVMSFYFKSKDEKKLKKHKPGQFLPFRIKTENIKYKNAIRTYSLSMKPNDEIYRISVKKVEGGLVSTYLHDELKVGDSIIAMPPAGNFVLKESDEKKPLVLISGGIGITPVLSMLYQAVEQKRDIYFIEAIQNSMFQPLGNEVDGFFKEGLIKKFVFYDRPLEGDIKGKNYDFKGHITQDFIKENLPLNSEFYFCGPPPFMKAINTYLVNLNVNKENINFEFFGRPQKFD